MSTPTSPLLRLALPLAMLATLALGGCVSTVCGDDVLDCKGRCAMAFKCKKECRQGACKEYCQREYIQSCRSLGVLYAHGMAVELNEQRAVELFRVACNNDDSLGCAHLGSAYENGWGVNADPNKALSYYDIGCKDNVATACLGKERIEDRQSRPAK